MKNKKDNEKIWLRIWSIIREYKKYFLIVFICLVGISFMTFLQPLIISQITDDGLVKKNISNTILFSIILLCVSVTNQGMNLLMRKMFVNIHNGLYFSLYKKVYFKIERLKLSYFSEKSNAEILNVLENDIKNISSIVDQVANFSLSSILQVIGGIVGLMLLDWHLAILILFLIPVKFIIVNYFSTKKNVLYKKLLENSRIFSKWFGDCINGIREMKLWDLFSVKNDEFEKLQKKIMNSYSENMMLDEYNLRARALMDAFTNSVLYILSGLLIIQGNFTIGGAFAFITYTGYVVSPISFLVNIKYYFAQIKPSAQRFFLFIDQEEENRRFEKITNINCDLQDIDVVLEMKDIWYGYDSNKDVLSGINLKIKTGEKVAIIGENGSGKSTLLDIISGFIQPEQGEIKVDGISTEEIGIAELRKKIAVVCQKPYFFYGTIKDNINLDGTRTLEEVVAVCKRIGATQFINKFDEGYSQKIGQDGAKLSGGEKQKIALARALLKDAELIILDEATSGFDKKSDKALSELLREQMKNKTVIVVTHKYEEIEGFDKIYKLENGKLNQVYTV